VSGNPWCFWGERPGYRFPSLARVARIGRLSRLALGRTSDLGHRRLALDAYRAEFGTSRRYLNLPYHSNLSRFQVAQPVFAVPSVTFLYSGSLSHRKGVDLLARAFVRLAGKLPHVRLKLMGEGRMEARLRREFGSCDRVEWVGFKDWDQLPAEYTSAAIPVRAVTTTTGGASWFPKVSHRDCRHCHQPDGRRAGPDRNATQWLADTGR
jgi:glycosyltransferase involved in cell wall biosynthesis